MSKYDFELDLNDWTSTGIVLKKIKRGSIVLEFGCAEGRMTRYMKEELGCKVYICEYDREAFEKALEYAEDGVCGDLCRYEWTEKFRGITFDTVLFVDVIEHISDPAGALKKAGEMLRGDGRILVCVPNITNNDIIIKAMKERFDYTSTGLLDETHIHFWGRENIEGLGKSAGLWLQDLEATFQETGHTEQLEGNSIDVPKAVLNYLKEREAGEVYQFIATFGKSEKQYENRAKRSGRVVSMLFFDRGADFRADDSFAFFSYKENGRYVVRTSVEDAHGIRRLRLDPLEGQPCVVTKLSAEQNGRELVRHVPCHIENEKGILIFGDDPQIIFEADENGGGINVYAEFIIAGEEFDEYLLELAREQAVYS